MGRREIIYLGWIAVGLASRGWPIVAWLCASSVVLWVVRPIVGGRRRREVGTSLFCLRHISVVTILSVQVAAAPVASSSIQAPARTSSHALCSPASVLLPSVALVLVVVVGVVVGAVVRVVVLGAVVASRSALAGSLLALVPLSVLLVAVVLDLLLLSRGEETTRNLLEELVGNLLSTVVDGFEC
jgi:hypothetical protein